MTHLRNMNTLPMFCINIVKHVKIGLDIIKLFCRGILRKYCVVAVYTVRSESRCALRLR